MRRTVFVDTSYLVALLDVRDRANAEAVRLTEDLDATGADLVTTDAVLIELGNYFAKRVRSASRRSNGLTRSVWPPAGRRPRSSADPEARDPPRG